MKTIKINSEEYGPLKVTITYDSAESLWIVRALDMDGDVIENTSFPTYPSRYDIECVLTLENTEMF